MSNENSEVSLRELKENIIQWFKYLVSRWKTIVIAGFIGGLVGLAYSYFRNPVYLAECNFVMEESKGVGGALGQYAGLASMVGIDIGGGGNGLFQGDNIIELYKSRAMLQKTLLTTVQIGKNKQLLIDRYVSYYELRKKWASEEAIKNISFQGDPNKFSIKQDSLLGVIIKKIKLSELQVSKPDKKLSIIKVAYKSKDELFAKFFVENLVGNVNAFYIATKTKKSLENVAILQKQTDSVKRALNSAIAGVAISADVNPNPNPARQILRVPSQRRAVDVQANTAILEELVKNLEISKVSLRNEKPLIQVIDAPILPLESDKIGLFKGLVLGGLIFGMLVVILLSFKYVF